MNFKNSKGVTLIALTITIVVMLIISGTVLYNTNRHITIEKLNKLYNDIENINNKIDDYYLKYGEIPTIGDVYCTKSELLTVLQNNADSNSSTLNSNESVYINPNDSDEYYIIDLEKLDKIQLNYGYEGFRNAKTAINNGGTQVEIQGIDNLFIINKMTHQVYYPSGIFANKNMYFAYDVDTNDLLVPKEYQRVEYIENTGSQYINTKYKPNGKTAIEIKFSDFKTGSSSNACLYGARGTEGDVDKTYTAFALGGTSLRIDYFNAQYEDSLSISSDSTYVYKQDMNKIYNNNNLVREDIPLEDFTAEYNMYLMASHKGEMNPEDMPKCKLYYCKIWDNSILVRYYIPCYRKSDSVIGLYDSVTHEFYTNSGTEEFEKGNDVI